MRYLPHTPDEVKEMLQITGHTSLTDLFSTIPAAYRLSEDLDLAPALTEWELDAYMEKLSSTMAAAPSHKIFLGAGSYTHYIPSALNYLLSRSEFATAYTPYQPEISQGTLQGIYEFQTMITSLLGMDIATASHYDCGTALAEAILIALRKNKQTTRVAVSALVHPHHRAIMKTYLTPSNFEIVEIPSNQDGTTDLSALDAMGDVAAVAVQSPNFLGCIEDLAKVREAADSKNALMLVSFTEAMAYGLLKNPGSSGADIVCGEGQSFGIPQSFGGPGLGILTSTKKFMRDLPGRLVGRTKDADGKDGFVLTLSTREQHIRREKASSNICSNNGLNAMAAGMYLAFSGRQGLRKIAQINHDKAVFLKESLMAAGFTGVFQTPFFNEFVLKAPKGFAARHRQLELEKGIVAGLALECYYPDMKDHYLFCATEVFSRQEMEDLAKEVGS
ncbi:MAG: aminomethyl-transferring glycine dehydrogenase subunit GcvPA [Desulfobacterium sp.]|jgi:glycine dehydrogenase subunit 1|nr:aminomethyl-transferring glycine dehydrogenase subunit GcvPA [Desulfobacterium sp.]